MSSARLATGRTYRFVDQKPNHVDKLTTTLLCVHGFPDLAYGWRHQIPHWVRHGYRVVAPDMLGYGKTDMPSDSSAYTPKRLCDDLATLLDHLGIEKAVVVGHDWGAYIACRFSLWHPDRLLALVTLSVPYTPPAIHYASLDEKVRLYPSFGYQLYFASEQYTAEIEAHLPLFLQLLFRKPCPSNPSFLLPGEFRQQLLSGRGPDQCFLSEEDLSYYVSNFQRGMTGPLSYYRTTKVCFEEERDAALPANLPPNLPVLLVYGTEDKTCPPKAVRNMEKFIDQLKVVPVPDVGHWIMLQAPQTVTETVLRWLPSVLGPKTSSHL